MSEERLEALVFYSTKCPRCTRIHAVIDDVKGELPYIHFVWVNLAKPLGKPIAERYHINRIPSIVVHGDIYFTGIPDKKDLIGTLTYLSEHPEGGRGVE